MELNKMCAGCIEMKVECEGCPRAGVEIECKTCNRYCKDCNGCSLTRFVREAYATLAEYFTDDDFDGPYTVEVDDSKFFAELESIGCRK